MLMVRRLLSVLAALVLSDLGGTAGAAEGPFKIYMGLFRGCEDACRGFKTYFRERHIPVTFIERDANGDRARLAGFVTEARELAVDLVMTWGTTVTLEMLGAYDQVDPARHITDIPAVFMIVSLPIQSKVVANLQSSGRNITGTTYMVPEETQMRALQAYRPFRRLGMVYNTNEANAIASVEQVRQVAGRMGFELVEETVPLTADNQPIADSLPEVLARMAARRPDLLYIGSSTFLLVHRDLVTDTSNGYGIPVAAAGEVPITQSHALMGLVSRYYNIGQLTAHQAERILVQHIPPQDMPIEQLTRYSFIINMDVARRLRLYPPMSVLRSAEIFTGAHH